MILQADARHIPLADGCVQTVVTSPPYWGLRDYGVPGQIGLEPTPEAYVETMVQVFREVRRVLRDDGTVWLNLGDSYNGSFKGSGGVLNSPKQRSNYGSYHNAFPVMIKGLKPKDLIGIPWRVAFALQADGWYLRSDIIWAKPNPMPESVTDRPTRSHEYLFLLSKNERYYYDADAIAEPVADSTIERLYQPTFNGQAGGEKDYGGNRSERQTLVNLRKRFDRFGGNKHNGETSKHSDGSIYEGKPLRNKRDVWTVNSEPTPEAHFATFPQKLIEPCILAGTSEKGCCVECGAPRVHEIEVESRPNVVNCSTKSDYYPHAVSGGVGNDARKRIVRGWKPSCDHEAPSVPCLVFDPFIGSGTTGKVAERLGRKWVGIELSEDYIGIAKNRTRQMGLGI